MEVITQKNDIKFYAKNGKKMVSIKDKESLERVHIEISKKMKEDFEAVVNLWGVFTSGKTAQNIVRSPALNKAGEYRSYSLTVLNSARVNFWFYILKNDGKPRTTCIESSVVISKIQLEKIVSFLNS